MLDYIRKSLLRKLTLSITLVALIPLLVFNFAFFRLLSSNYANDRINHVQNILGQLSTGINTSIESYMAYGNYLANDLAIMGFVNFEQDDVDIIETVNNYIRPWCNRLMYSNTVIKSIRILHDNDSLFNVNNLLYRTNSLPEKFGRVASLNHSARIPIQAVEYLEEGELYNFTPYSIQDKDVWYLYHTIAPISRTQSPGLIEIAISNSMLFHQATDLSIEADSALLVITDSHQIVINNSRISNDAMLPDLFTVLKTGTHKITQHGKHYVVVAQRIDSIAATALYILPESNYLTTGQMGFLLALSIFIILSATIAIGIIVSRLLLKKLLLLSNTISNIELDDINQTIPIESPDETGQLAHNFNMMLDRLNRSFAHEKQLLFAQLTSNMKPHFICNVLEMLRIQAEKENQRNIALSIAKINQYFRYSIMYNQSVITLAEEISDTINYIELVNLMRQHKIRYSISYDAWSESHAKQIEIPKQIIQPIVENSIKHGLQQKTAGCITIHVNKTSSCVNMVISDNGMGMPQSKLDELRTCLMQSDQLEMACGSHMGLINVCKRLDLKMPGQYRFSIESHEETGTIITIMLQTDLADNG